MSSGHSKFTNTSTLQNRSYRDDPNDSNLSVQAVTVTNSSEAFVWQRFGPLTIPAGNTAVVDTNLLSAFSRIDYIINFKDSGATVTKSMKLVAQNNAGVLTDSVSERMGGSIDVLVNVTDDAVDAFLEITNNEAFDIEVTFLRAVVL